MLIMGMTAPEIRVLQEFRRVAADSLDMATVKAIKHPAGGGEEPARGLVAKGFLAADDDGQKLSLTAKARDFLAIDAKPENESAGGEEAAVEA
jgi:hypothetical protein